MKKSIIIISALCIALGTSCYAQTGLQLGFRFNPEFTGLINKSDADAGDELNYSGHFTYISFGIGALYNLNNNIGFGVDILFSREGQAFKGNFTGAQLDATAYSSVVGTQVFLNNTVILGNYDALAELNYIKVPLMLSLTSDNVKPLFFTMLVGPQFNFLQGVAQEVNGEDLEYPNSNIEPKDLYQPVVFAGVLAVGGAYNLTSHLVFSMRLRLDYGFNDAEQKDVLVSYSGGESTLFYSADRKSTHSATVGLLMGLDFRL